MKEERARRRIITRTDYKMQDYRKELKRRKKELEKELERKTRIRELQLREACRKDEMGTIDSETARQQRKAKERTQIQIGDKENIHVDEQHEDNTMLEEESNRLTRNTKVTVKDRDTKEKKGTAMIEISTDMDNLTANEAKQKIYKIEGTITASKMNLYMTVQEKQDELERTERTDGQMVTEIKININEKTEEMTVTKITKMMKQD